MKICRLLISTDFHMFSYFIRLPANCTHGNYKYQCSQNVVECSRVLLLLLFYYCHLRSEVELPHITYKAW